MSSFLSRSLKQILPERAVAQLQALDHWFRGEPELRLIGQVCSRSKTAVDVGANIGTYTHFMRKYARSVIAYEPNPILASRLERLYPDVRVRNVAVSDRVARVLLKMPVTDGNPAHALASISQTFEDAREVMEFEVSTARLDDESLVDLGFLKIDVEQHEREVLLGALGTIRRCRPIIMTETTPLLYQEVLPRHFGFVIELGYVGWFTFRKRSYSFDQFDPAVHANPDRFGTEDFMNPNAFLVPQEISGDSILNR